MWVRTKYLKFCDEFWIFSNLRTQKHILAIFFLLVFICWIYECPTLYLIRYLPTFDLIIIKNVKTSAVNHSSKFEYSLEDLFYFRNISVWKCSQWKIRLLWHSFRKNECVIVPLNKMKLNVMTMNHEQDSMCIWR